LQDNNVFESNWKRCKRIPKANKTKHYKINISYLYFFN
jgi:hypothetical protein